MPLYRNSSLQYLRKSKHALAALAMALVPSLLHGQAQPGPLDTSFGNRGIVTTDFDGSGDRAAAVAIQPDGKIVAAGTTAVGFASDFALARYNPDGTLDAAFGSGGKVLTDLGVSAEAESVAVQRMGRSSLVGTPISTETRRSRSCATTPMARSTPASAQRVS